MRIRAITLSDVRQFTRPVRIDGFDNGLNVLSAPNEAGKSTLFDAILAVFFSLYRSNSGPIKLLRPLVGGNPAITLEIEIDGVVSRIEKVWGKGAKAEIFQQDRLIAKADDAEAWISRITIAQDGGPAGLLWVRQGSVNLDHASERKLIEQAQHARRDLLSSVTGAVDSLTGGRRMDRALALAEADLDRLVTQRGAKAGGPYDAALKLRTDLTAQHAEQKARSDALHHALGRRRAVANDLHDLTHADAAALRQKRLDDAAQAHAAALRHAEAMEQADLRQQAAKLQLEQARRKLDRFDAVTLAVETATHAVTHALAVAKSASSAWAAATADLDAAKAVAGTLRNTVQQSDKVMEMALRAEAARSAAERRQDLEARLVEATTIEAGLSALRAAAKLGPDRKAMDAVNKADQDVILLERMRAAGAAHFALIHSGTTRALLDGVAVPDGDIPILGTMTLTLPGLGHLRLSPGAGAADLGKLTAARQHLSALLAAAAMPSLLAARAAMTQREAAGQALRDATTSLRIIAPGGLAALCDDLAALPTAAESAETPTIAQAEVAQRQARDTLAKADAQAETLRVQEQAARDRHLRAGMAADVAQKTLSQSLSDLQALGSATRAGLLLDTEALDTTTHALAQTHDRLAQNAPDLAACIATLARARSVRDQAEIQITALREERIQLDTLIAIHAGNGIEEELADTETRLAVAIAEVAAWEREIAVLRALIAALEQAQTVARDRYFDPVMAELRPMLRLLWPDATLQFDAESLLPTHLTREDRTEEIGTLSGGTREQIALLVRLAFARLLAKSGRHAPVILDDALVYTDDDRIERMFDALHQQAGDLQIIILSCRSKVFRDLGGQKLTIRTLD